MLQSLGFERQPLVLARPPARLGFENLEERRVLSGLSPVSSGLSPVLTYDPAAASAFWSGQLATGSPLLSGPVTDFAPPGPRPVLNTTGGLPPNLPLPLGAGLSNLPLPPREGWGEGAAPASLPGADLLAAALGRVDLSSVQTVSLTGGEVAASWSQPPGPLPPAALSTGLGARVPSLDLRQLPQPATLVINGVDNVNDSVDLDLTSLPADAMGHPLVKTIIVNGGAGGFDTLRLSGGTFQTEVYTPTGKDSGIITYSRLAPGAGQGEGTVAQGEGAAPDLTIIFTGLEPVYDDNESYSLVVDATGAEIVSITDNAIWDGVSYVDALTVYSPAFESITFASKSFLVLDTGGDTVNLEYTRPAAELNQIQLYGNGQSTYYTFQQPPDGGTLGNVSIQKDAGGSARYARFQQLHERPERRPE